MRPLEGSYHNTVRRQDVGARIAGGDYAWGTGYIRD